MRRAQHARDASEAGLPVLQRQLETFTGLATDELAHATLIDTASAIDAPALARALDLAG